eukprot:jgi/Mesen1/8217/ME000442S07496
MSGQAFHIAVVGQGLRPAETYTQLCYSLQLLADTSDAIFDAISGRVAAGQRQLHDLSSRVRAVEASIEAVAQSRRPIIVRACSKYPARPAGEIDYVPLFCDPSESAALSWRAPPVPPSGGRVKPLHLPPHPLPLCSTTPRLFPLPLLFP